MTSMFKFVECISLGDNEKLRYKLTGHSNTIICHANATNYYSFLCMITEDDFRVCLDANESIDGTDYINASFLRVS